MEAMLQRQLVRRVLAHVEHRTTDTHASGAPTTLPVAAYADAAPRAFRTRPIAVAHASRLARPGDFVTHDEAGVPLLVVRGDDGALHAMLNVCRHRGTRVEAATCGAKTAFTCPYHAWSYGRDGALIGVPHERQFGGVPRAERGLARVAVREIAGLVFVQLEGTSVDADYLGPLAAELVGFGIASGHVHAEIAWSRQMSWRLAIDVFLETYHLKTAHKDSIYPLFFDNLGLVDPVGPHLRNVFPKRTIRELAGVPEDRWELRRHANVLYHLFPNTLVLVEPDHSAVVHMWPAGPDRTELRAYLVVPEPPATEKVRAYWDANAAILYGAVAEDLALGESIQRGLASGANREVMFGAFEHALAHFHRMLDACSTAPTTSGP